MGAETFITEGRGLSLEDAFQKARRAAQHSYGHDGYTGTIAEKYEVIEVQKPGDYNAGEMAKFIDETIDRRFDDKWGPCGGMHLHDDIYVFFGWASS